MLILQLYYCKKNTVYYYCTRLDDFIYFLIKSNYNLIVLYYSVTVMVMKLTVIMKNVAIYYKNH